jgi:hypothetical protein
MKRTEVKTSHVYTEEQEAELGKKLAEQLNLKKAKGYSDRWDLGIWGTKTAIGVFRVFSDIGDRIDKGIPF